MTTQSAVTICIAVFALAFSGSIVVDAYLKRRQYRSGPSNAQISRAQVIAEARTAERYISPSQRTVHDRYHLTGGFPNCPLCYSTGIPQPRQGN